MSHHDVPGANAANGDELAMGCWAEHKDGSLVYVSSTEGGRVVFEMFDDLDKDPITAYRHAMTEREFKRAFSWPPTGTSAVEWTWHDKTPFDWDRIIGKGLRPGMRYASADDQMSAAERVARSMDVRGTRRNRSDYREMVDAVLNHPAARDIIRGVQDAIDRLGR